MKASRIISVLILSVATAFAGEGVPAVPTTVLLPLQFSGWQISGSPQTSKDPAVADSGSGRVAQRACALLSRQYPGRRGLRKVERHVRRRASRTVAGVAFARGQHTKSTQPAGISSEAGLCEEHGQVRRRTGRLGKNKLAASRATGGFQRGVGGRTRHLPDRGWASDFDTDLLSHAADRHRASAPD